MASVPVAHLGDVGAMGIKAPMTGPALKLHPPEIPASSRLATHVARRVSRWVFGVVVGALTVAIIAAFQFSVTLSVRASGVLEPIRVWPMRATEGGILTGLMVRTGDSVRADAFAATLTATELDEQLLQLRGDAHSRADALARARVAVPGERSLRELRRAIADARVIQARSTVRERLSAFGITGSLDSLRRVHVTGSHLEIDRVLADLDIAEAEATAASRDLSAVSVAALDTVREAQALQDITARINQVTYRRRALALHAPASGVVITPDLDSRVGTVVRPGDAIFEVADTRRWIAKLSVTERDVQSVALGDSVFLRIPALRAATLDQFVGTVVFIAPLPRLATQPTVAAAYELRVAIDSAQTASVGMTPLRSGYSVEARVQTRVARLADVLRARFAETLTGTPRL